LIPGMGKDIIIRMRPTFPIIPATLALVISLSNAQSEPRPPDTLPAAADTLDAKAVHSEYAEGNFESVTQMLEGFRTGHGEYRRADSLLLARYLGVVYASHPDTREKGKYWLYKMLQIDPAANLVDLYVGGDVDRVFEKVRQEFIMRRNYRGINDTRLAEAVQRGAPEEKDTVVVKDTVVLKDGSWIAPLADGIKGGYGEVKGGIKAGIQGGYVPIEEESRSGEGVWTGNINFGAGIKFLDAKDWKAYGFTDQTFMRLAMDIRQRKWPINVALDFTYAFAPEVLVDLRGDGTTEDLGIPLQTVVTYDVNVGVRKIFDFRLYSVRPFFGGGFGRVTTQWAFKGDRYDETYRQGKIGIWCNGGIYWELGRHFNIGLEYLYSWASIELLGKRNHGGSHVDMIAGYHF
jgi:hypothetical protein